jgi:hypothetical protein
MWAEHGTGDELIGVSARQQALWTRIGARILQRRIALEPGKVRKALQKIA